MKRRTLTVILSSLLILVALMGCAKKEAPQAQEPAGIAWITDIQQGLKQAAEANKPLMVDFMATWCPPCKMMEDSTFSDAKVIAKAQAFIPVRIDVDQQGDVANAYQSNAGKYGGIGIPNVLFLDAQGQTLKHPIGFKAPELFLSIMDSVLTLAAPQGE